MTHAHPWRDGPFGEGPGDWREAWMTGRGRGPGGPGRHGFGGGRRGRYGRGRYGGPRPRGDVRAAILLLLDEEPRNGYGIMQEIEERSAGVWRPSPGSVYPVLQQLEDEGLVRADESGERKVMELTDAGRQYVAERREALGTPWDTAAAGLSDEMMELRTLLWQLRGAVHDVLSSGTDEQHVKARDVLVEARRSLYRILAGDEPTKD